jgi:hypothetical protein
MNSARRTRAEISFSRSGAERAVAWNFHNYCIFYSPLSDQNLDHCGCLRVGQLLNAPLAGNNLAHFRWQIGVLLLLTHLQARQVRILQLNAVFIEEVFGHGAFNSLATLQLKRETGKLEY